jgi:hypothetical protein
MVSFHVYSSEDIAKFIPEDYSILYQISGDINTDRINDIILILKKNNEEKLSTIDHPLKRLTLILIGQKEGSYRLLSRNENAVLFYGYDPNFIDAFVDITITEGKFSINHYGGFSNRWGLTTTFISEKNEFILSNYEYTLFDSKDMNNVIKSIIQTSENFGKIYFKDFDIYQELSKR